MGQTHYKHGEVNPKTGGSSGKGILAGVREGLEQLPVVTALGDHGGPKEGQGWHFLAAPKGRSPLELTVLGAGAGSSGFGELVDAPLAVQGDHRTSLRAGHESLILLNRAREGTSLQDSGKGCAGGKRAGRGAGNSSGSPLGNPGIIYVGKDLQDHRVQP